jgi:dephospho-CoA kinase
MGKSAAASRFRALGITVCDADALVHLLYAGQAVLPIEAAFPGTTRAGQVDRQLLSAALLSDPAGFKRLESIVHPLVKAAEAVCVRTAFEKGEKFVILEVPLLFETGGEKHVDKTVVVSAPLEIQKARVMQRPGMTEEKFKQILARQMPDAEKRARADFVVDSGRTLAETEAQIDILGLVLPRLDGQAFETYWRQVG